MRMVKENNHNAWYLYGPLIGRTKQECVVESSIEKFYPQGSLLKSDIVIPNFLNLEILSSRFRITNIDEAIITAHVFIFQGSKVVFIKKLF
ncbi:hypothetical protein [Candidatus Erwinia haradaeae]|uniref:hypothetical protein n=1 Tax=Candidatus Erwinia haradaeae TaxID=1922217 RepID=UPI001E2F6818|nr:hypothetical protein [Candidatus Erwinia haradaeae]